MVNAGIEERRAESFDHAVEDIADTAEIRIEEAEAILAGLNGLFVTGDIDRGEFHDYIGQLEGSPSSAAIQALAYARPMGRSEVAAYEEHVRSDTSLEPVGYPDFAVYPEGVAEDLYVVDYIEPMAGNEAAFGFDLGSNAARRAAVEKARDTGEMVATEGIQLVQDAAGPPAVLLMLPVYRGVGEPSAVEDRRALFIGVVDGVFRVGELLDGLAESYSGLSLSLSDAGEFGTAVTGWDLLLEAGSSIEVAEHGLYSVKAIDVGDRRWVLEAYETEDGFGDPILDEVSAFIIVLGLLTSAAFAFGGYALMSSREKAQAKARQATVHLEIQAEELRAARDEALEADRLKTVFLANMSHELRTPLSAVIGLGGMLANGSVGELNEKQLEYARKITNSGTHLLALIDELLDLARIEADKEGLDLEPTDLLEVIRESVEVVQPAAPDGMIEPVGDTSSEPIVLLADARRLRQVLINLLNNAVKFTPPGGRVGVDTSVVDGFAEFVVWDTGIGIDPSARDRIFEPFFQIDNSLARQYEGSGLGLALTERIVEIHGGEISVESHPGDGSRFRVLWPLAAPGEQPSRTRAGESPPEALDLRVRSVVIAEDSDTNLQMLIDLAEMRGWLAIPARDGAEAVRLTRTAIPDLVLMDIHLPIMDGLIATRILKDDPSTSSIPILAVSARAMPSDLDLWRKAGCDEYLIKPFTPEEFDGAIARVLGTRSPAQL